MEKQCKVNSSTTKHKSFGSGLLDKRVKDYMAFVQATNQN